MSDLNSFLIESRVARVGAGVKVREISVKKPLLHVGALRGILASSLLPKLRLAGKKF